MADNATVGAKTNDTAAKTVVNAATQQPRLDPATQRREYALAQLQALRCR